MLTHNSNLVSRKPPPVQLWLQEHKEVTAAYFSVSTSGTVIPQLKVRVLSSVHLSPCKDVV